MKKGLLLISIFYIAILSAGCSHTETPEDKKENGTVSGTLTYSASITHKAYIRLLTQSISYNVTTALAATPLYSTSVTFAGTSTAFSIKEVKSGNYSEIIYIDLDDSGALSSGDVYYLKNKIIIDGDTAVVNASSWVGYPWDVYNWSSGNIVPTGWDNVTTNGEAMTTIGSAASGTFSYTSTVANQPMFRYNFTNAFGSGSKLTFAFKAKYDGTATEPKMAWNWTFQNTLRVEFDIQYNNVRIMNGTDSTTASNYTTIDTTAWHTYYITLDFTSSSQATLNLYIDGSATAAITKTITATSTNTKIMMGDSSTSDYFKGSMQWFFWRIDGAFAPDSVALPTGYSLVP
jgi:hypothetical protein